MAALFGVAALFVVQGGWAPRNHDTVREGGVRDETAGDMLVIETGDGPQSFSIEVARTAAQKSRGLMFRTKLDPRHGMLFPYDTAKTVSMWMRNTYIPLDMIFIAGDGRVHSITVRAQPHSEEIISSKGAVSGVLEIGGGEAARLGIRVGDLVRHSHFGTSGSGR